MDLTKSSSLAASSLSGLDFQTQTSCTCPLASGWKIILVALLYWSLNNDSNSSWQ